MKQLSRLGLILVGLFLLFAGFSIVSVEYCFRHDGIGCGFGYFLPGFPWNLLALGIPDGVFAWLGPKVGDVVFWMVQVVSCILNLYLAYWYGRVFEEGRRGRVE
jgi:hypothetical protein